VHGCVEYQYGGEKYSFSPVVVFLLTFVVGVVGGIYGIDGGAIIAPFFVAILKMPVYTIAGAALMGTFITSVAGVIFYHKGWACIMSNSFRLLLTGCWALCLVLVVFVECISGHDARNTFPCRQSS